MAGARASAVRLTMTIIVVVAILTNVLSINGASGQSECPGLDVGSLITECGQYVQKSGPKKPPSKGCCDVVKKINLPCACKYVNKDVERMVSVEKAVYVAQYCGLKLKHGTKCGSRTGWLGFGCHHSHQYFGRGKATAHVYPSL